MANPERPYPISSRQSSPEQSPGSSHRAEILARLEQAVGQIQDSETFRQYLDVQARFHHYSFGNVALILFQCPDATRVAGYNTWLKLHRYVRRGEQGIRIIVPMRKKKSEDDPEEEARLFFGIGNVFDVSQTEGEDLPDIDVPELHGDTHEGRELLQRMGDFATRSGLSVRLGEEDELREKQMGYYSPATKAIVLRPAEPLQMVKTLAHELAHHYAESKSSDAESETIAEAVAYVVCSHFGLDTGARSFPYIAVWSQDKAVLKNALTTVQRVSAKMIDGVEGNGSGGVADPMG